MESEVRLWEICSRDRSLDGICKQSFRMPDQSNFDLLPSLFFFLLFARKRFIISLQGSKSLFCSGGKRSIRTELRAH